jgi:hypothetical protein
MLITRLLPVHQTNSTNCLYLSEFRLDVVAKVRKTHLQWKLLEIPVTKQS